MKCFIFTESQDQLVFDELRIPALIEEGLLQPDSMIAIEDENWERCRDLYPDSDFKEKGDFYVLPIRLTGGTIVSGDCGARCPIEDKTCWMCQRKIWPERSSRVEPDPVIPKVLPPPL